MRYTKLATCQFLNAQNTGILYSTFLFWLVKLKADTVWTRCVLQSDSLAASSPIHAATTTSSYTAITTHTTTRPSTFSVDSRIPWRTSPVVKSSRVYREESGTRRLSAATMDAVNAFCLWQLACSECIIFCKFVPVKLTWLDLIQQPAFLWTHWATLRRHFYFAPVGVRNIMINICLSVRLCVCLCVCLSATISLEPLDRSARNFVRGSTVAVGGSVLLRRRCATLCTSGLWMTSRLAVMGATPKGGGWHVQRRR